MTKRAAGKFERNERDFYATPEEPILKLLPELVNYNTFAEPMCGDGAIVRVLEARGWDAAHLSDMQPEGDMKSRAIELDVMDLNYGLHLEDVEVIVSNPPWPLPPNKGGKGGIPTVPIINHLRQLAPTWLLLSSDFMHNKYFADLHPFCSKVIAVGRVSWQGNGVKGLDNAAWYRFEANLAENDWFVPNLAAEDLYHPSIGALL